MIDWSSGKSRITGNFTVREACWLPSWGVLHRANAKERANLIKLCDAMEKVRTLVGKPISVHCMLRPKVTAAPGTPHNKQDYNAYIKGARQSAHIDGLACDFSVPGMSCDDVRALLEPHLEVLEMRMERLPAGSSWVHLDLRDPQGGPRYFKP